MLVAIFLGLLLGIIAGVIPGIHINLLALLVMQSLPLLQHYFSILEICIIILSFSTASIFFDHLANIFTGIPDSDNFLSALPGHRLLLEGKGHEAIIYATLGSFFSILLIIILSPVLLLYLPTIYALVKPYTAIALIAISVLLMILEKEKKIRSVAVFLLAGALGLVMLNSSFKEPLFLLFTGAFGVSSLLNTLNEKIRIPQQITTTAEIKIGDLLKMITKIFPLGIFLSLFPAIGPSQISILSSKCTKTKSPQYFLFLSSCISSLNLTLSIFTLYLINKARNGPIVNIGDLLETITPKTLMILLSVTIIIAAISTVLILAGAKKFVSFMAQLNYTKVNKILLAFIVMLTFVITGITGFFGLILCAALGLYTIKQNIPRHHLMGSLIIPVILYLIL